MFPFWDVAIAPVLERAARDGSSRSARCGARRPCTMLDDLGPDAELHVIDPVPDFDPREHERAVPRPLRLPPRPQPQRAADLPPMDAALIDGDHNWYTVYHELRMLAEVARRGRRAAAGADPARRAAGPTAAATSTTRRSRSPRSSASRTRERGMRPARKKLLDTRRAEPHDVQRGRGGRPAQRRDDRARRLRGRVRPPAAASSCCPIYFGLAIVVEEERLARQPELAAALDRLESRRGPGRAARARGVDPARGDDLPAQRLLPARTSSSTAAQRRYLDVAQGRAARRALPRERGAARAPRRRTSRGDGRSVAIELRDPVRNDQMRLPAQLARNRAGPVGPDVGAADRRSCRTPPMGRARLDHLERCLDAIRDRRRSPATWSSAAPAAAAARSSCAATSTRTRCRTGTVWVADRFRAAAGARHGADAPARRRGRLPRRPQPGARRLRALRPARRPGALPAGPAGRDAGRRADRRVALLRIGRGRRRRRAGRARRALRPARRRRLRRRRRPRRRRHVPDAVEAFRADARHRRTARARSTRRRSRGARPPSHGRRPAHAGVAPAPERTPAAARTRRAPPTPIDLSVVVVFYNMRREAARTLHSLSRAYQRGHRRPRLRGHRRRERLRPRPEARRGLRRAASGPSSATSTSATTPTRRPSLALNRGIRAGRGRSVRADDRRRPRAHARRPALRPRRPRRPTRPPSSRPSSGTSVRASRATRWTTATTRPTRTGCSSRSSGRATATASSRSATSSATATGSTASGRATACSSPASQLEQVGGFDESFSMPGGGYANLELYERLGSSPDVTVCDDPRRGLVPPGPRRHHHQPDRRRPSAGRGCSATASTTPSCGAGRSGARASRSTTSAACPTRPRVAPKPRRMSAAAFADERAGPAPTACPTTPTPVPDELAVGLHRGRLAQPRRGRSTTLARPARSTTAPTDLLAYQEIIAEVRPDWIIETGTGDGGRALFLASICELVGHGQVLSIDAAPHADRPEPPPPRATSRARPHDEAVDARCAAIVGDGTGRSSCSARAPTARATVARVRGLRAARPGRLLRGRHRHRS